MSEVSEVGRRPLPDIRGFCHGALNLHHGDEESEQDVLCQDGEAERHRWVFHVAMIVAGRGRPATTTSANRCGPPTQMCVGDAVLCPKTHPGRRRDDRFRDETFDRSNS